MLRPLFAGGIGLPVQSGIRLRTEAPKGMLRLRLKDAFVPVRKFRQARTQFLAKLRREFSMAGDDWIPIAKLVKVHGLQGGLKAASFCESDALFTPGLTVSVRGGAHDRERLTLENVQTTRKGLRLRFKGITTADEAETLTGALIAVRRMALPALEEGEHYWFELQGLTVRTERGEILGTIDHIIPTGANDVYVVTGGKKEYLIPALRDVVLSIDTRKGEMVVRPLEGLLEL